MASGAVRNRNECVHQVSNVEYVYSKGVPGMFLQMVRTDRFVGDLSEKLARVNDHAIKG